MYCVRKHGTPDTNFVKSIYHDVTFSSFSTPIPATPRQDFPNFPMIPKHIYPMTPISNFDYSGGSANNNGNNLSSENDFSGKADDHAEKTITLIFH